MTYLVVALLMVAILLVLIAGVLLRRSHRPISRPGVASPDVGPLHSDMVMPSGMKMTARDMDRSRDRFRRRMATAR